MLSVDITCSWMFSLNDVQIYWFRVGKQQWFSRKTWAQKVQWGPHPHSGGKILMEEHWLSLFPHFLHARQPHNQLENIVGIRTWSWNEAFIWQYREESLDGNRKVYGNENFVLEFFLSITRFLMSLSKEKWKKAAVTTMGPLSASH